MAFYLIVLLHVFNVFDGLATIYVVGAGLAEEANPVMRFFLDIGPVPFMLAKLILVSVSTYVLWLFRSRTVAKVGLLFSTAVYGAVCLHHVFHLIIFYGV